GLFMGDHQRRPLHSLNHVGHRKSLAGTSSPQQRLESVPLADTRDELIYGLRLIPLKLVIGCDLKSHGSVSRKDAKTQEIEETPRLYETKPILALAPRIPQKCKTNPIA